MKLVLVSLYDLYSNAVRGLHAYVDQVLGYDVASLYIMESTYTDGLLSRDAFYGAIEKIRECDPEYVGISVRSPLFLLFARLCQEIRVACPKAKIIAGGPHAEGSPESCLQFADLVCTGDGEVALKDILSGDFLGFVHNGRVKDLDSLPFPHYGDNTFSFLSKPPLPVVKHSAYSQRGCPFGCHYCQESISRKKPIRMSVGRLKGETDYFLSVFPDLKTITFSDSIFLRNQEWMDEFAEAFGGSGLAFWCWGFAPFINDEMLRAAKAGGIKYIRLGVQSGSEHIRRNVLGRHDTLEQIRRAAKLIDQYGFYSHYDFIIENPYDTPETMKETRDFIRTLPSDSAWINKFELRYWPGTEITRRALKDGYITPEDVEGNYCRFGGWSYIYSLEAA